MGALDGLTAVAGSLHRVFGRPVTYGSITRGDYEPGFGVSETTTESNVRVVFGRFDQRELNETIRQSDLKATMAADGNPTPQLNDILRDGDTEYRVVAVMRQEATDDVAYYTLALRQ